MTKEEALKVAIDELAYVSFFANSFEEAIEERENVEQIIRNLARNLTPDTPRHHCFACPECGKLGRVTCNNPTT